MASGSPRGPKDRKRLITFLAAGSLVLFAILLSESSFDLPFINPSTTQQTVFLAALSALVFLLFVTLTFVLARNLIKLFAERRWACSDRSSGHAWLLEVCCSLFFPSS